MQKRRLPRGQAERNELPPKLPRKPEQDRPQLVGERDGGDVGARFKFVNNVNYRSNARRT